MLSNALSIIRSGGNLRLGGEPTAHRVIFRDCSIATGADSKIARQEQGESTWDPLNACELAPNAANSLIPSLIAWAKSQPPGNVAIVSIFRCFPPKSRPALAATPPT